ncbi:acyl carrier protein [Verrucomicrobiaceae bacterium 227]
MMSPAHDPATLRQLIDEQLFSLDHSVTDDSDLYEEGLDSMALMQLILLLEQEFGIVLDPADLNRDNFASLNELSRFIGSKNQPT